jgi:undecaprenyl diphosphate synthase
MSVSAPRANHVAIIMDGNGRWAERRGLPRTAGHVEGAVAVRETVRAAVGAGLRHLTLYAFSVANWQRPRAEVDALMGLLVDFARSEAEALSAERVRVQVVGDRQALPEASRAALEGLQSATLAAAGEQPALTLSLALSYGSRRDLLLAAQALAAEVASGARAVAHIDEAALRGHLTTAGLPDVDLLIRTGGEQRLSDFLLFEAAHAELHFTEVLWPDFRAAHLTAALEAFAGRERRFGRTGAQLRGEA